LFADQPLGKFLPVFTFFHGRIFYHFNSVCLTLLLARRSSLGKSPAATDDRLNRGLLLNLVPPPRFFGGRGVNQRFARYPASSFGNRASNGSIPGELRRRR